MKDLPSCLTVQVLVETLRERFRTEDGSAGDIEAYAEFEYELQLQSPIYLHKLSLDKALEELHSEGYMPVDIQSAVAPFSLLTVYDSSCYDTRQKYNRDYGYGIQYHKTEHSLRCSMNVIAHSGMYTTMCAYRDGKTFLFDETAVPPGDMLTCSESEFEFELDSLQRQEGFQVTYGSCVTCTVPDFYHTEEWLAPESLMPRCVRPVRELPTEA
jgi:hypothetical protein